MSPVLPAGAMPMPAIIGTAISDPGNDMGRTRSDDLVASWAAIFFRRPGTRD
ncbi:MAG: hypothetical protein ABI137_02080 [Antricoccus sp.]